MSKIRVIARLDIKNEHVIKGIQLEGLRKVGNPNKLAKKYYEEGIDEIIFMDAVAAYYDRNSLSKIIEKACIDVFVPITVGGGIRNINDIQTALNAGADKVAINTQAIKDPTFIQTASKIFGSQCIVSSIVAKKTSDGNWEAYVDNGREPTGKDVLQWSKQVQSLGAGEIILTSIDQEGTKKGYDIALIKAVSEIVSIPIIASGGAGSDKDLVNLASSTSVNALSVASILHYETYSVPQLKASLLKNGIEVRK